MYRSGFYSDTSLVYQVVSHLYINDKLAAVEEACVLSGSVDNDNPFGGSYSAMVWIRVLETGRSPHSGFNSPRFNQVRCRRLPQERGASADSDMRGIQMLTLLLSLFLSVSSRSKIDFLVSLSTPGLRTSSPIRGHDHSRRFKSHHIFYIYHNGFVTTTRRNLCPSKTIVSPMLRPKSNT